MRTMAVIRTLGPVDVRSITRDSMLRWLVVMTPGLALLYRFVVPAITEWLSHEFEFDLTPYYGLLMSLVGIIFPGFVGAVIAFLLLDQRDDQTLPALLVTPMSLNDYLWYRLTVPTVVALVLTMLMFPLAGFHPIGFTQVLLTSLCGSPLAAMYALFIGSLANNKVQGFALAKAVGVLLLPAIAAYFMPMPWQVVCGIVPHYWTLKVFWLFDEGALAAAWACAAVALAYQALLLWLLGRYFARVVRR